MPWEEIGTWALAIFNPIPTDSIRETEPPMSETKPLSDLKGAAPDQPELKLKQTPDYRVSYANSVQVRMSVWDFSLVFGTMHQESAATVEIDNFQGIFLSPQQAKALWNLLGHNLAQYEQTFGTLALEPKFTPPAQAGGPVN
jgi:hypothetical protein